MGKVVVLAAAVLAGCGGGAATSSSAADPPAVALEASAPESDASAIGDRDVKPENVSQGESDGGASDAHGGPWLPLVAPDASAMAVAACVASFSDLAADCGARSALSRESMSYVNLCDLAHVYGPQYCEGVTDTSPGPTCVSKCWRGTPTTQLSDALCVFRCYDAAICGSASSEALTRCDDSDGGAADPVGCLISDSCYPSFDSLPW